MSVLHKLPTTFYFAIHFTKGYGRNAPSLFDFPHLCLIFHKTSLLSCTKITRFPYGLLLRYHIFWLLATVFYLSPSKYSSPMTSVCRNSQKRNLHGGSFHTNTARETATTIQNPAGIRNKAGSSFFCLTRQRSQATFSKRIPITAEPTSITAIMAYANPITSSSPIPMLNPLFTAFVSLL